jgi:hypothetical protein
MYYFKNFYTLKPSTHIKINFKITPQHVSVPLDHHQGARRSYPKVTTDRLSVRYIVVLRKVSKVGDYSFP